LFHYSIAELYEYALQPEHRASLGDSTVANTTITETGALSVHSGRKSGRVPKEKRIVYDEVSKDVSIITCRIIDIFRLFGGELLTFHSPQ